MSTEPGGAGGALQLDRVELATPPAPAVCSRCRRAIESEYFAIGGNIACRECAAGITGGGGLSGLARALLFGGGAAVLGTIVWFAITRITDHEFGLIAIGVGLLVGFAVRRGSGGRGGRKYQLLAMALTYVSITASYVPLVLKGLADGGKKDAASGAQTDGKSAADDDTAKAPAPGAGATAAPAPTGASEQHEKVGLGGMLLAVAIIFGIAFASPFLAGTDNIMGIIIIGIALYEAWKINRRIPVAGPFQLGVGPGGVGPLAPPAPVAAGGPPAFGA
jgi:hypothetical protein